MVAARRWFLVGLLVGASALAVVRIGAIRGLVTPFVVSGGSMAEALCGDHVRFTCTDCRFTFRCDADALPAESELVCPNCGAQQADLKHGVPHPADRVWIDRWPYLWRAPARFDILAVRQPDRPGEWAVKRVVALPGEHIAIRDGDLFDLTRHAAPRILQKSLEQWRSMAVLVHDSRYEPAVAVAVAAADSTSASGFDANVPRWAPRSQPTGWTQANHGWTWAPPAAAHATDASEWLSPPDWLTFRNVVCHANPLRRRQEEPVMDNDGYNQAVARTLHPVRDLALVVDAHISHSATMVIAIDDGVDVWAVEFSGGRTQARLLRGERSGDHAFSGWRSLGEFPLPAPLAARDASIEFVRCDGQILVGVDGWSIARIACGTSEGAPRPTSRPVAIGVAKGAARIGPPRVYRDVYYLGPATSESVWSRQLAPGEYLLLGDNPPISIDSRSWPAGSITRDTIIGKVIPLAQQPQSKVTPVHVVVTPANP